MFNKKYLYTIALLISVQIFAMEQSNQIQSPAKENPMNKTHTVVAILEAKPEKIAEIKQDLLMIAEQSRKEPACIEFYVHQDKTNPATFILYENWKSAEDHQKQFQKSYILDFAAKLGDLLAKPYQGFTAEKI